MKLEILQWKRVEEPTETELELLFAQRNLAPDYHYTDLAGSYHAPHSHSYNKLLVIAEGKMKWHIAGKTYLLKAGDAIVLSVNTVHEVWSLMDAEYWEAHY